MRGLIGPRAYAPLLVVVAGAGGGVLQVKGAEFVVCGLGFEAEGFWVLG